MPKLDIPFKEVILSWNALRPQKGKYSIYLSIKHSKSTNWSRYLKVAEWGKNFQRSFKDSDGVYVKHWNVLTCLKDCLGKGFRVRVIAEDGASLDGLKALFVTAYDLSKYKKEDPSGLKSMPIPIITIITAITWDTSFS